MKFFDGKNLINEIDKFIREYNTDIKPILLDMYDQIKSQIRIRLRKEELEAYFRNTLNHSLNAVDTVMEILKVDPLAPLAEQMRELGKFEYNLDINFLPKDIEKKIWNSLIPRRPVPRQFSVLDKYLSF